MIHAGFDRRDLRLTLNLFRMMLRDRYLGSALGGIWAVLNPMILLALFTFIFGVMFRSKLPGADTTLGYAMWLIAGYGPWIALTESIMIGTMSVVANASMIKNLALKVECLPIAASLTGLVSLVVAQCFLVVLLLFDGREPGWALLSLPFIVLLQFLFITGLVLFLSALSVFIRDLALVLPNLLLVLLFASPVLFPVTVFPTAIRGIVIYSPFAILADGFRQPLLFDSVIDPVRGGLLAVLSVVLFYSGLWFFRRLKPYFDARI